MQEMSELEKQLEELLLEKLDTVSCYKMSDAILKNIAKHIQRMVVEARLNELEVIHEKMDGGDFSFAKEERIAELTKQIEEMK